MVSPLGCGVDASWSRLIAGENGADRVTDFEVSDMPCQIACQIPKGDGNGGTFDPNSTMPPKEQRKVDDFIVFAMAAADEALSDAGWKPEAYEDQIGTGVLIGSAEGDSRL